MNRWVPIPPRQPGEVLPEIHFSSDKTTDGKDRYYASFRHRDNRVWQAVITGLDTVVDEVTYRFVVELSSGGCRSWRFLAGTFEQAKRTVCRFSNMEINRYRRLVLDAKGTNEFPVSGQVGVFRMRLCNQQTVPGGRTETTYTDINGIARYDGEQIVVYPRTQELTEIISDVCTRGTIAMIPQQINEIQDPTQPAGIMLARRAPTSGVAVPSLAEDDLLLALDRLRDDTTENVLAGVQSGSYRVTHGREERVFDLNSEE